MRLEKKRILVISLALVMIVFNTLLVFGVIIPANAQSSLATISISSLNEYSTPGSDPWGTAFDSSGRVWVALPGCDFAPSCSSSTPAGALGLFDPNTQSWISVPLPSSYGQPIFPAVDRNGNVWFTMPVTNALGMYNPTSNAFSQWAVPTASAGPWGLAIDSKGLIWFTEHYGNQIGSFDPVARTFKEIATPATNSQPYGIAVDASNNIWFTENPDTVALIGEYTNQGVLQEYKIRNTSTAGTGLTPHLITLDHNGNVWWSEGWVHSIGMLNVAAAQPGTNQGVTEYQYTPCSGCGSHTSGISVDGHGLIWLDDSLENVFGAFPVGGGSFTFFNTRGHPHDGLNVDSQNRVWYDEDFANNLAVAIPNYSLTPTPGTTTPTTTGTATSTPTPTTTSTVAPTPTSVSGTPIAQDTFQRANQSLWGTASDGHVWGGDANSQTVFSISGNAGVVTNTGSTSYSAVLGSSASDAEVYVTGSMSAFSGSNFGDVLRWTDGNNWYKAYIDGASLIIQKKVSGATTVLASVPFAASGGTSYSMHFRVIGTTLTANVWAASGSEPSGWMATASDSSLSSGQCGLRILTQSNTATITAFRANALASGSPTPTPTATSTSTATPTLTATVIVSPTATSTPGTLAQDTFHRANQSLWGTASDGHMWGGDANSNTAFSISNNAGVVSNGGGNSYSAVLGSSASNAEVYATGSMSAFSNSNFGDVLRWTDGNNWYKAYIDGANLIIQKKVSGATTILASVPFAASGGTSYSIHFRVVGTTLTANVWAASGSEPSGWMAMVSDSSLSSGQCGLRILTQANTLAITAFQANAL